MNVATIGERLPVSYRREAGKLGAKNRSKNLSKEARSKIARKAAKLRWNS